MLADNPIDPMILATDLGVAKEFYGDRIGLEVLIESEDFLTFRCGGDSPRRHPQHLRHERAADQGLLAQVSDLAAEVANLRSRGVEVEEYDEPG